MYVVMSLVVNGLEDCCVGWGIVFLGWYGVSLFSGSGAAYARPVLFWQIAPHGSVALKIRSR